MNEQYSSSYGKMTKKKGSYNPSIKIRKLNVSVPPISRKTTNMRRKMFGKGKKPSVRMSSAPTNQSPKAVSKVTSGRPGVGKLLVIPQKELTPVLCKYHQHKEAF
jgi:hypothetical protein